MADQPTSERILLGIDKKYSSRDQRSCRVHQEQQRALTRLHDGGLPERRATVFATRHFGRSRKSPAVRHRTKSGCCFPSESAASRKEGRRSLVRIGGPELFHER